MAENLISISNPAQLQTICGSFDANLKQIEQTLQVSIVCRGETIKITGSQAGADLAEAVLRSLAQLAYTGQLITEQTVRYTLDLVASGQGEQIAALTEGGVCVTATGKVVRAKTVGQQKYVDAIRKNTIVFGIGPAGTGKTYLAVAMAVKAFKRHEVDRIILTRPAVEAGEKLGFLPGDLQNKVDPYLRPLYDGLFEMMGAESFQRHMERGSIEVAPLAYMRGRTLEHAFIILDEAQNTTSEQMKMFLTRLGENSKMVITGDLTQIDLPEKKKSGLFHATKILRNIHDISILEFTQKDVVRHKLVQDIIRAYEKADTLKGDPHHAESQSNGKK